MARPLGVLRVAARATWNGPFYVGRLARPVSVGEALLKLFETIWRACIVGMLALIATVGAALALERVNSGIVAADPLSDLKPHIVVKSDACEQAFPLLIAVENKSKRVVNKTGLRLEARKAGRSTNLVSFSAGSLSDDAIIKPGELSGSCWAYPELSETVGPDEFQTLVWTVRIESADWAE